MRLIVDTTTGLAVVGGKRDFDGLEAVIIGSSQLPACRGLMPESAESYAKAV